MSIHYMNLVWKQETLKGGALLVMLALADHANDDGECWPSQPHIAAKSRLTVRQVQRVITKLTEDGLLAIQEQGVGRGNRTVYQLLPSVNGDKMSGIEPRKRRHSRTVKDDIGDTKGDIGDNAYIEEPPIETPVRESVAAAPPTPAPAKRSPSSDPAVGIYVDIYGKYPDKAQCALIADTVTDMDAWRAAVRAWMGRGYSPRNVLGMLEWYHDPSKYLPQTRATAYAPPKNKVEASWASIDRVFDRLEREGAFAHA